MPDVTFTVNGREVRADVDSEESLLETLRDRAGCRAVRGTCQIGICGTCSVLVDGQVVSSCLTLAARTGGRDVTTPEGLTGADGRLSDVQEAFVRKGAYQCSFCIPAMVLSVHSALADEAIPNTVESIKEYLAGNLCRCGTYPEIVEAVAELTAGGSVPKQTAPHEGACEGKSHGI